MNTSIAKNTLYQITAKIFTSGTGFFITIFLARYLGVLVYGDFIKITSYVGLFFLLVDFGLNAILLQRDEKLKHFKDLFYLRIIIAFLVFLVLNIFAQILPYNPVLNSGFSPFIKLSIFVFSFSLFAQAMIFSASSVFQKSLAYSKYMIALCVGSITNLSLVLFLILIKEPFLVILFAFVFTNFLSGIIGLFLAKERLFPISLDWIFIKKIFFSSLPLGVMLVFNLVYFRADTFILSILKSSRDVGIYGLSYKFFDFLIALPLFLSNSLYPYLLKNKKNTRIFFNLIKNYLFIFVLCGVILIFPFWFLSPLFALIKPEFLPATLPFKILLLSLPVFFASSLLQWSLISLDQQKYLMYVYLLATAINILLNIIFIPYASYVASAIITGVCEILVLILLWIKLSGLKILLEKELQSE